MGHATSSGSGSRPWSSRNLLTGTFATVVLAFLFLGHNWGSVTVMGVLVAGLIVLEAYPESWWGRVFKPLFSGSTDDFSAHY